MGMSTKIFLRKIDRLYAYLALAFLLFIVFFPFYWMVSTSFKTHEQMQDTERIFFPHPPVLINYRELFEKTSFLRWFRNSAIVSFCATSISLFSGCLGAYSLTRLKYRGRATVANSILITYLVPPSMLFIPLYYTLHPFRLTNKLLGLIIVYPTFSIPFCTWLLMGFFKTIPLELEEAALIDGATRWQAFTRVILPLTAPGIVAAALFTWTMSWNEFLYALVFIADVTKKTIPVGLSEWILGDVYLWGRLMAAATLTSIPVVSLYIYLQKYMIAGLTAGGIKG